MTMIFIFVLLILAGLFAMAVMIRDIGKELSGMDESSKTTEERKNEKIRKEIEKWREGK